MEKIILIILLTINLLVTGCSYIVKECNPFFVEKINNEQKYQLENLNNDNEKSC